VSGGPRLVPWPEDLGRDVQYGLRAWRRHPGFAIVAIVTLALGIGATTAVFSVVEAVLLRPLPYADVGRLVAIWDGHVKDRGLAKIFASYEDFENWQRHSRSVEPLAAATWATGDQTLTDHGAAKLVLAIPASAGLFSVLGVPPALGRTFDPSDLTRGCAVVLAHRFWRNTLAADRDIVGRALALDNRACTVVGVMPERFAFYPDAADMWTLILPNREQLPADNYQGVGVFGRLRPGVTLERAQAELSALHAQAHGHDAHGAAFGPTAYPLQEEFTWLAGRNLRLTLWVLFAAVNAVLLIACINVANLLLGRSLLRQREFAIRAALGSGRWRVARQVLTEALLLALSGTALGVLLAEIAVQYFRACAPVELPPGTVIAVSREVLGFAVVLAISTALVFGLVPAWRASRTDVSATLKSAASSVAGRPGARRAGGVLIALQMTCAMVLLVAAGLLTESIINLGSAPLGFNPDGVITMTVKLPRTTYPKPDQRSEFFDRLVTTLAPLPAVQGVGLSTTLLRGHGNSLLTIEGRPAPTLDTSVPDVGQDFVSPDYFRVMGVPAREGRLFERADRQGTESVAVVNEALARKYFPGLDPIGQRIKYGTPPRDTPWSTIVGVVGNQKSMSVYQEMNWVDTPLVFRPLAQSTAAEATVVIRTAAAPSAIGATIQRLVAGLDAGVPIANVQTMRQRISKDLAYPQFRAAVLGSFAILALVLAVVGLYAVLSQLVGQRTHEFGVRMALGARSLDIVWLVSIQGGVPIAIGLVVGMTCTLAFGRVLSSLLYGVKAADPMTVVVVGLLLVTMSAVSMLVPAQRATNVDPLAAVRSE
jgi:putative ABC transport system permease protein